MAVELPKTKYMKGVKKTQRYAQSSSFYLNLIIEDQINQIT